jgi:sensor histidine kinase YesM
MPTRIGIDTETIRYDALQYLWRGKETVTLKEEVEYLKNYIELHKMRYHKNIEIDFNCDIDENCKWFRYYLLSC